MSRNTSPPTPSTGPRPPAARRRAHRAAAIAVASVGGAAVLVMGMSGVFSSGAAAHAAVQTNCQAAPHTCGYPDATNTGLQSGTQLKTVPDQVSSGTGWSYNASAHEIEVTGNGAVLSGLSIAGDINVTASNVTITNTKVTTTNGWGISLRHTANDTIQNSVVTGANTTSGRLDTAISDRYSDSTGILVKNNNISQARSGIQVATGTVSGNYIHDTGYITGDHTNGVIANGGTGKLAVTHNTILTDRSQTDAITLDTNQVAGPVTNKTITNNLIAGGGFPIYGGTAYGHATSGIHIENNRFGQGFYATSGQWGPVDFFAPNATGNTWTGNVWDSTGNTVPAGTGPS